MRPPGWKSPRKPHTKRLVECWKWVESLCPTGHLIATDAPNMMSLCETLIALEDLHASDEWLSRDGAAVRLVDVLEQRKERLLKLLGVAGVWHRGSDAGKDHGSALAAVVPLHEQGGTDARGRRQVPRRRDRSVGG